MKKLKLTGAQAFLVCGLSFLLSCNNNTSYKNITKPPVNEHMQDSTINKYTSTATIPQAGPHKFIIDIKKMQFNPAELSIQKGDTVVWVNNDLTNHCITEVNKTWTSSTLVPGKNWQKVFNKPADYYCNLHMVMKGKILVQ